jgi:hypothetical protein
VKAAPPGWEPHKIVTRLDGWLGAVDRIPPGVAAAIIQQMPSVDDILAAEVKTRMKVRARMVARAGLRRGD